MRQNAARTAMRRGVSRSIYGWGVVCRLGPLDGFRAGCAHDRIGTRYQGRAGTACAGNGNRIPEREGTAVRLRQLRAPDRGLRGIVRPVVGFVSKGANTDDQPGDIADWGRGCLAAVTTIDTGCEASARDRP